MLLKDFAWQLTSADNSSGNLAVAQLLQVIEVMQTAVGLHLWRTSPLTCCTDTQLAHFISTGPLLVQQVQRCAALLPAMEQEAAAAAAAATTGARQLQEGTARLKERLGTCTARALVRVQQHMLHQAALECRPGVPRPPGHAALLAGDHIAAAGLQLLCAYAHVLYEQQQQQPQLQHLATSSSSVRKRPSARLLAVPPVHERLALTLLPAKGRHLYLATVNRHWSEQQVSIDLVNNAARGLTMHLMAVRAAYSPQPATSGGSREAAAGAAVPGAAAPAPEPTSPAVTAHAVLLVVEVMLLLASAYERERRNSPVIQDGAAAPEPPKWALVEAALKQCALLLEEQLALLAACPSPGFSIRRQVVQRNSGRQLLQLLRWQVLHAAQGCEPTCLVCYGAGDCEEQPLCKAVMGQLEQLAAVGCSKGWGIAFDGQADTGECGYRVCWDQAMNFYQMLEIKYCNICHVNMVLRHAKLVAFVLQDTHRPTPWVVLNRSEPSVKHSPATRLT